VNYIVVENDKMIENEGRKFELRNEIPLETRGSYVWVVMPLLTLIQHKDMPFGRNKSDSFMNEDLENLG